MNPSTSAGPRPHAWKLYSYVVVYDTGFAPNPFYGYCTLACCKPAIRRSANIGDGVVGLTPKSSGSRVAYYMRIDEIVESFDSYWRDRRFARKKPRHDGRLVLKCGDNIYKPLTGGEYRQLPSMHSDGDKEDLERKEHDLGGKRILVSETFAYFGNEPVGLPPELNRLIVGRAHKCRFTGGEKAHFIAFVRDTGLEGVRSAPRSWFKDDDSWARAEAASRRC